MSDGYPRPWRVEQRVGKWYVVDAAGGIVAGSWDASATAWEWLDRYWPNYDREPDERER